MHLTNKEPSHSDSRASGTMAPDAGAPEIEITEEMMKAGCCELYKYHYDKGNDEEIVKNIFRAMIEEMNY
jgi:hypothetical protein